MALTNKEKEFANYLVESLVKALRENSPSSQNAENGRKSACDNKTDKKQNEGSSKKSPTSQKKLTIADFEPKGSKSAKGYENWNSYNAQRTKYAYFVATNGEVTDGVVFGTTWYKKVDYAKYNKAKAAFEKKYHYVKKEDRA